MASRKTCIWIVGGLGAGAALLVAVAGAGVYFVSHHIRTEQASTGDAFSAFDAVTATFQNQRPLYELDSEERPRLARPLADLPTSSARPGSFWILAWDPDDQRLVKVSLPFWMLRVGHAKMRLAGVDRGFDLQRLNLDSDELERIGPALVFDFRDRDGVRVLLWTQ